MFYMVNGRISPSLLRRAEATTINNPVPQLRVSLLEIVIHNDLVMGTGLLGELQLIHCLIEALAQTFCISEDFEISAGT